MFEVPYLSDNEIEEAAQSLIASFVRSRSAIDAAPVPIERLISFLGLRQEIDDLYKLLKIERDTTGDLLGALCVRSKRVLIHNEIDPEGYPWREGRYNFTLAHEVGHWVLHRNYIPDGSNQLSFLDDALMPEVVCRKGDRNQRIEWQANKFASFILMPRKLISSAWQRHAGQSRKESPAQRVAAIKSIAEAFQCSIQATRIRLATMGLIDAGKSPDLAL